MIRKVAVLGAGVMGAQIAAHLVNARVPVLLFDLAASEGPRNGIALAAIERLKKLKPAPFGTNDDAKYLVAANYDDDLDRLAGCDLVIEAIAERLDWKHGLYEKVAPFLSDTAIFASNTSGLSITALADGFASALKGRFCGVHFFNPPRYMHLVELIPTADTRADIVDALETFLTRALGKGVVRAKDTPNFIANRVGVFSILATITRAAQYGLGFDVVDDLTGSRLGRAKSATFRTADVVGLDTLAHVVKTMQDGLPDDPFAAAYATPALLRALVDNGALGQKSGAGFYRKIGRDIHVLDTAAGGAGAPGAYRAASGKADELVVRILKRPLPERLRLLRESTHPQARFLWAIFRDVFHYVAVHLEAIADGASDVDLALRWGFGWEQGPFEIWQAAGWTQLAGWIAEDIAAGHALSAVPLPRWVTEGPVAERGGVHDASGSYSPARGEFVARSTLPVYARQVFRAPLFGAAPAEDAASDPARYGRTVFENAGARIWTDDADGGDVLVISFRSKMNTIGPEVLEALRKGVELAEAGFDGLLVWQTTSLKAGVPGGPFSAGANLEAAMPLFMTKGAAGVEPFVADFQQTMLRIKYAQVPVVAAISGIALGGGCELALHVARRVAHFESYLGLVEIGVGLVPAGGGLKEAAIAAAETAARYDGKRLLDFLTPRFTAAATAKVSTSAHEARQMGYLQPSDRVVFNVYELLDAGRREVRALAAGDYRPPLPAVRIPVAGRSAIATIRSQLVNMRDGRFISEHDYRVASRIAEVICGGDVEPGTLVDEHWLLALERRAFVELLGTAKTQERIMSLLQGGKPARN
ncbi:3-hydroxyacyl-CoA dehydrogenase/enoyl-CoA hydratase family protein [Robbsia sp. Bb-Pol-6]|uniref:3-hydroxyacyl-CoA dehydrogenase/enoyl-CoA hydratase family protein n=1 Tax=Robbsia betulipollinis TaxID=2981849 RepID=A0ABT3ZLE3_9BURK|nr:3-hydroxyacyl-CoA dehydrogenase/enoyl-CoA hydratase family protein [Robbsia betulipollinis]MCY0387331.1 3-hydroxyacyl-CoA dehydrogenase/enoyl-CoA hydratase family protein [Robbsia betulipollinis]